MRWESETKLAAENLGWRVVDTDGVTDWQGWGVHLLRKDDEWAVLAWSYGSCGVCDAYEDLSEEEQQTRFGDLIERAPDEESARKLFSDRKGW